MVVYRSINFLVIYKKLCIICGMGEKVLFAWIGRTDLKASQGELGDGLGPIWAGCKKRSYAQIVLLSNYKRMKRNSISIGSKQ